MQQAKQNFKIQFFITILSIILFTAKIVAYYFTHSLAILTDALESIVNVVAGFIGLFSLYIAAKPKDIDHPYGHGKAEFVSAAIEGTLILTAGFIIIYQTIKTFFTTTELYRLDKGLWLIAATAVINFVAGSTCIKFGKKNNSLALQASGKHLQTDTYSTLVVIIGLVLILFTKLFWLDKLLALAISMVILYNGYKIIRASLAGIMDEADMKLLREIIQKLNESREENWIDLHNLRVIKYGSLIHIDCHLTIPWYFNVREAHKEIDTLTKLIKEKFGDAVELFVHTDACLDTSCSICIKPNCDKRKHLFQKKVGWTLENVLLNKRHDNATT
ncbi:MAG: cation transporter [Chitinophagaceae bacterium]|nr:cation transporter [Chitinophagaceae bacterium]MCW5904303.1 cation transporter [Chitinophagaceae bacterium]